MIKLGYESRSELFADLQSNEHNMAKVFVAILTGSLPGADTLPWRFGDGDGVEEPATDINQFMFQGTSSWGAQQLVLSSGESVLGNSVIERTLVAPEADGSDATRVIEVSVTRERLVFAIQDFLNRSGIAWFHPHERRIIARSRSEPPLDLTFDAKTDITGDLRLELRFDAGPPDQFALVAEATAQVVAGISD
jgi:hypothetical protein